MTRLTADAPPTSTASPRLDTLREVIETLAPIERRAGSPGEEQAARWLAERLAQTGCPVEVDEERFHDGYARVIGTLSAASALSGVGGAAPTHAHARGRRRRAGDRRDRRRRLQRAARLFRRATAPLHPTWNVSRAWVTPRPTRTLVVLAHHDAAPTGAIFDDQAQAWLGERFPGVIERIDTSLPLWWALMSMPAMIAAGALAGPSRHGTRRTARIADRHGRVRRRRAAPGVSRANDNLSAVAVLVALAEQLREHPVPGLRVLLVSCGAEEVLQGGIHGFAERHFPQLDRDRTWFLNLDTVGSPRLILLEGEGPVVMEDYHDRSFRDLVARAAERAGVPLRRGMRSRNSTDAVIPSRAGYPTTTITSMDRYKALSNYHKMSDTPENVDYRTVAQALVARRRRRARARPRPVGASPVVVVASAWKPDVPRAGPAKRRIERVRDRPGGRVTDRPMAGPEWGEFLAKSPPASGSGRESFAHGAFHAGSGWQTRFGELIPLGIRLRRSGGSDVTAKSAHGVRRSEGSGSQGRQTVGASRAKGPIPTLSMRLFAPSARTRPPRRQRFQLGNPARRTSTVGRPPVNGTVSTVPADGGLRNPL